MNTSAREYVTNNLTDAYGAMVAEYRRMLEKLEDLQVEASKLDNAGAVKLAAEAAAAVANATVNAAPQRLMLAAGDFDRVMSR